MNTGSIQRHVQLLCAMMIDRRPVLITRHSPSVSSLFSVPVRKVSTLVGVLFVAIGTLCAQTAPRPRIVGISHIGLLTHDLNASRAFYGDFLGFQEPYSLSNPDGSLSMTFFKVNDHQYIELYPERSASEANKDRETHISFETDDIEGLRAYLASKGVAVPEHAHQGRIGNLSFEFIDPAGHRVEMVQYMPSGKTVAAYGKYMSDSRISKHMMHVGIIVTTLDPEYRFYTEILGFKETWRGSSTGKTLSWVNLKLPDADDYLELMLFKDEPEQTHRGTPHHLCLEVPDIPSAVATPHARPYAKMSGGPIEAHVGVNLKRQVNLFDPDGTRTELMEPGTVHGNPPPPSTAPPPG